MSATTRLVVLGAVRIFQPVHGYELRRELVTWHVEEWASLAPGSIYNALKSLTREGLLEIVGTKQVGSRPERTTYRLTSRGESELSELVRDTWWNVRAPLDPLMAGLSFLSFMPRAEAIAALEARIAKIEASLKHAEYLIAAIDDSDDPVPDRTPAHVREMMRLINARTAAEIPWAHAFIKRLRAGQYRLAEDKAPNAAVIARVRGTPTPAKRGRKPATTTVRARKRR